MEDPELYVREIYQVQHKLLKLNTQSQFTPNLKNRRTSDSEVKTHCLICFYISHKLPENSTNKQTMASASKTRQNLIALIFKFTSLLIQIASCTTSIPKIIVGRMLLLLPKLVSFDH